MLETLDVGEDRDLSRARQLVRVHATRLAFSELNRTRMVTAASELVRNMLTYGGGGRLRVEEVHQRGRIGLRATFTDSGPGIEDLDAALRDGYSTGRGLGLGLGGARRLVDEFALSTDTTEGTIVSILNWQ